MISQLIKRNLRMGRYGKSIKIIQKTLFKESYTKSECRELMLSIKFLSLITKKIKIKNIFYKRKHCFSSMLMLAEKLHMDSKKDESLIVLKSILLTDFLSEDNAIFLFELCKRVDPLGCLQLKAYQILCDKNISTYNQAVEMKSCLNVHKKKNEFFLNLIYEIKSLKGNLEEQLKNVINLANNDAELDIILAIIKNCPLSLLGLSHIKWQLSLKMIENELFNKAACLLYEIKDYWVNKDLIKIKDKLVELRPKWSGSPRYPIKEPVF